MLQLLEDLIAETGKSVFLCTHLLGDVERLCQQIVVLDRGTVVRAGTMDEMRAAGQQPLRAELVGRRASRFAGRWSAAGVELADTARRRTDNVMVIVPDGFWHHDSSSSWPGRRGAMLTELKADEENLERLFFRVTGQSRRRGR